MSQVSYQHTNTSDSVTFIFFSWKTSAAANTLFPKTDRSSAMKIRQRVCSCRMLHLHIVRISIYSALALPSRPIRLAPCPPFTQAQTPRDVMTRLLYRCCCCCCCCLRYYYYYYYRYRDYYYNFRDGSAGLADLQITRAHFNRRSHSNARHADGNAREPAPSSPGVPPAALFARPGR